MKSRIGYSKPSCRTTWHKARHHSLRDVEIYQMLADDIKSGRNEYVDSKSLSDLYEERLGQNRLFTDITCLDQMSRVQQ